MTSKELRRERVRVATAQARAYGANAKRLRIAENKARGNHLRWSAQAWYGGRFPRLAPHLSAGGVITIRNMLAAAENYV